VPTAGKGNVKNYVAPQDLALTVYVTATAFAAFALTAIAMADILRLPGSGASQVRL